MRQTLEVSEITGFHELPVGSYTLKSNHDFVIIGVAINDIIENVTSGQTGVIKTTGGWVPFDLIPEKIDTWLMFDESGYCGPHLLYTDVWFNPGDFFIITLATPHRVVNEFGPIYEYICKLCGVSYRREDMSGGRCPECQDN